jgi:hypothetical protein
MRLKLISHHREVPPDGYRFTHPETGHKTESTDERAWLKSIRKYREDNGFVPIDEADIYDQFCKLLPPGWCVYENGNRPTWFVDTRLGVREILNGTKVMASLLVAGMPLVSKEKAAERALICSRCYYNVPISGCAPCLGLSSLIERIGGDIKTPSDASLKSCAICICSNKAQTRLPIEILAKGVDAEMLTKFKSVPFCWKGQELSDIDSNPQSV